MANDNAPFGFVPENPEKCQITKYSIASGYGTSLFIGDPVTLSSGTIVKATEATANAILGMIVGFDCDEGIDNAGYYPASSTDTYYALVADAPEQRFVCRDDGSSAGLAVTDIGSTGQYKDGSGDTTTNLSGCTLNATLTNTAGDGDQLQLVGFVETPDNTVGSDYAKCIVRINNHYYN